MIKGSLSGKAFAIVIFSCVSSSFYPREVSAMTVQGAVIASSVTVAGEVSMAGVTASTISVLGLLNVTGTVNGVRGLIIQTRSISSTDTYTTASSTLTPVPGMSISVALSSATNYLRISLTGTLETTEAARAHLSIQRDATDLGGGSLVTERSFPLLMSTGIIITDAPGDTSFHTYQVTFSNTNTGVPGITSFSPGSFGYFLIEEIAR